MRNAPPVRVLPRAVTGPQRVVPPAELPPVEPTRYVEIAPEDAREINAAVPFSASPNPAARPFRFAGSSEDLARATDCLAAAVLYEAGDDAVGERAVAQVILNRLRHPAFPKTVCGVVFQGHERGTGCQFTFTCDGALTRWRPSEGGWRRAREIAAMALNGSVYRPVGHATHYHTDWVVPYWSSSLDKITAVGTHLFFRWTGWWGTPPAFNRSRQGPEPAMTKIAHLSEAHRTGDMPLDPALTLMPGEFEAPAVTDMPDFQPLAGQQDSFLVTIPDSLAPEMWPMLATRACGDRPYCKVLAWTSFQGAPAAPPITPAQASRMSFSYLRDRSNGFEKALWNCREVKRDDPRQCMKQQLASPNATPAPEATPARGPGELDGVRRRSTDPAASQPGQPRAEPAARPAAGPPAPGQLKPDAGIVRTP